jgi:hypothetical protein
LNSATFYVENSGNKVPATISYNGGTNTASLAPTEPLAKNTTYTVHVTTGVKDLSGNALPANVTWNFTTVNTEIDPVPGAPSITSSLRVDAITTTQANLSWVTSEATNYTLIWGRNNNATGNTEQDLLTYTSLHTVTLNPLTPGKRYYAQLSAYNDIAGNAGAAGTILEFNALTNDAPDTLAGGIDNQHTVNAIQNKWGVANSGAFVFWTDENTGFRHIYAQKISSDGSIAWTKPLNDNGPTNYFFLHATEDEIGGFIILSSIAGSGIYAKRFDANGSIIDWGMNSDQTSDLGIEIDPTGTIPSAVIVYSGTLQTITSGTATHASMSLHNLVF